MAPRTDRSLIHTARPAWRCAGRLPMLATLTERVDALGELDDHDVTAAGGTDSERVWGCAANVLRDALEGGWLGSPYSTGRVVALRYVGPLEGDERAEWIDLAVDLRWLVALGGLFALLSGEGGDWPWAHALIALPCDASCEVAS